MPNAWLLDPGVQITALDEGEERAKKIAKSRAKLHKLAVQMGIDAKEVGFIVEVGPILGEEISVYNGIVKDVNNFLQPYGLTLEKMHDMGNRLRGLLKDLILKESLPFNQEAVRRLRVLNSISLNLVENMKVDSAVLAQLVFTLEGLKYEDVHQKDKENIVDILQKIIAKLKDAAEIRPHTKKAQTQTQELLPLMDTLMGYFKEYEPTKMRYLPPESAKALRTVPYKTAPHVEEQLKEGIVEEASAFDGKGLWLAEATEEIDIDEGEVMQVANTIQQVTARMDDLADQMDWIFENFNPIYSELVNLLSSAVTLIEGAGVVETEIEAAPALALASTRTNKDQK